EKLRKESSDMMNRVIRLLLVTILLVAPAMFSFQAEAQTPASMKGKWNLTTVRDGQRREITFDYKSNQLVGSYLASDFQTHYPISAARLRRGSLTFRVSDQGLYFELRFVGSNRFEGRMFTLNKKTPERVYLSKQ